MSHLGRKLTLTITGESAMAMNRIQFQRWMSLPQFFARYGSEERCESALMDSTKLPLRTWFLAIFLVSQDKTGLSSLALMRHLGTTYRTAWLIHQKLMAAMARFDSDMPLHGTVQVDDAYLGSERPCTAGRGSPNKVPIVAAVQTNEEGHPLRVKLSPMATFSRQAIAQWSGPARTCCPAPTCAAMGWPALQE